MNVMNVVRIAKVIALLAFVLPWVAISCSIPGQGTVDLATASGIELIQGKMTANPDAEKQISGGMGGAFGPSAASEPGDASATMSDVPELGLNVFGIAAAAIIVIGLALSFVGKGKSAARNVLVTSLVGAALVFATVWWWKDQMKKQDEMGGGAAETSSPFGPAGDNPFGGADNPLGGMSAMGASALDSMLQERFGYWIALGALLVAAGAGAIGMTGGAAASKPEDAPPAA
jgi:hypothetical protein